ncbi:MAG: c-type cytochrome [Bacteroidales bacterium]|nr:c-type cytochrome [Bacteroidales bacterium]
MMIKSVSKILLTGIFMMSFIVANAQGEWTVPDKFKNKKNPVAFSKENIKKGQEIFNTNCKSCHGDFGKNNGIPLVPKPTDMGNAKVLEQTDGEIFYKITEGRITMPSFKNVIQENDRWAILSYVRSMDPNYKPAKAEAKKAPVIKEEEIKPEIINDIQIILQSDREACVVKAVVVGKNEKGEDAVIKDAEIGFFVKRYFGELRVDDKSVTTDKNGVATIEFPADLPGDEGGNVEMTAKLMDQEKYAGISVSQKLNIAKHTVVKNMLDERALWGTRAKTPFWLLFMYLGLTGGIWMGIVYIVFNVFKLKKLA